MISDLYDATVEAFRAYACPAEVFLGEQFRSQSTAPLRVVMWQGQGSPPDQFGPQNASVVTLPTQQFQFINPRPVATRRCGFSVEMWATAPRQRNAVDQFRADLAYLDALINQFAVVLQQKASGIFMISSGMAAPGNGDANVSGLGYMMQCYCDVPIIDARWPAQQLNRCTETWAHGRAQAEISVEGPKAGQVVPPPFLAPTEDD